MARSRVQRVRGGAGAACPTRRRSIVRVATAACALVALAAVPAGAQMLTQVAVVEPPAGASVAGSRVVVEVRGIGQADMAQARITAGGQTRASDLSGPESIPAGSRWSGNLNLSGLPNGPARVEARARFAGSESPTEWSGHDVRLDLPAPAISLTVSPVAGRPDAVALTWSAAGVPDVTGYEVQRALAGGGYEGVLTAGPGQHAHTDVSVPPGDHRYRVRALRPGADGGSRPGPWAEGAAILAGAPDGPASAAGDGDPTNAGPVSGVASRPPTGGISARLRSGTENMSLPEGPPALGPLVAPRDLPAAADAESQAATDVALGPDGEATLAVTQDGVGFSSDAVRLLGLALAGFLALWAHRLATRPIRAFATPTPSSTGDEVWRGARDWSRAADAA